MYHFTGEAFQGFLEILMGQDKMSALSRSLVALSLPNGNAKEQPHEGKSIFV